MKLFHRSSFVSLGMLAAAAALGANATARPIEANGTIVASAADLRGARDLGRASATTPVHLAISLRLRDERSLDALIASQSNPHSPFYHHYLKAAQLRDAFGASAADYARTVAELQRSGFAVERVDPLRTLVNVTAPAATVERYFSTSLHAVTYDGRHTAYANVTPARLPATLVPLVSGIAGLKSSSAYKTSYEAAREARSTNPGGGPPHVQAQATTAPTPVPTPTGATPVNGPDGGYGPQLVTAAFDHPIRHGYFGNGVAVADLIDGFFDDRADIAPYLAEFRVKRTGPATTTIPIDGGCGSSLFGCFDSVSAAIDAEQILGVAPGVAYYVYELPSFSNLGVIDGLRAVVSDNRVDVVNIAFGGCETRLGEAALLEDEYFKLGAAEGMTFAAVSFGGSNPCFTNQPSVQAPADSPNVLAIGGADTFVDQFKGLLSPPIANNGSGGGVSRLFNRPSYQAGIKGTVASGRNVPDLAGPAAVNAKGASEYYSGFGGWIGGSFAFVNSAPLTGGIAEIAQISGSRLGIVNDKLYPLFAANGYTANVFRDVTLGCNGTGGGGPYCAAPGFDLVTGIGVPDAYKIAKKL